MTSARPDLVHELRFLFVFATQQLAGTDCFIWSARSEQIEDASAVVISDHPLSLTNAEPSESQWHLTLRELTTDIAEQAPLPTARTNILDIAFAGAGRRTSEWTVILAHGFPSDAIVTLRARTEVSRQPSCEDERD